MKCLACDKILSDFESTRRSLISGEFMDLCNTCYTNIEDDVPALSKEELSILSKLDDGRS